MERDWDPSTPAGLRAILERPRVSLSRACQAVEQCLAINRYVCVRIARDSVGR